jgi:fido (protein-threonine AMPylation protein)
LTAASREIRERVARPLRERRAVGFHAPFLEYYTPNASAYLSTTIRKRLHDLGRTTSISLPPGTYFRSDLPGLGLDLVWNSNRLSGGSHTLPETRALFERGEFAAGRSAGEAQLLMNQRAAIQYLARQAGETGFDRHTLSNLHSLLSDNLLPDPSSGGRVRTDAMEVSGSVFEPLKIPQLVETRFEQVLAKAAAVEDPFEQSFFSLVHLCYLQPFESLNGRVARLAANLPFLRHNLVPLTYADIPRRDYLDGIHGVYELNRIDLLRDVFIWAYERACARYAVERSALGQPDPFRLRHRDWLVGVIGEIVRGNLAGPAAGDYVREQSGRMAEPDDRARAADIIGTELACLHEGNIARYQITPLQLQAWRGSRVGIPDP